MSDFTLNAMRNAWYKSMKSSSSEKPSKIRISTNRNAYYERLIHEHLLIVKEITDKDLTPEFRGSILEWDHNMPDDVIEFTFSDGRVVMVDVPSPEGAHVP